jgi:hypothetical protein
MVMLIVVARCVIRGGLIDRLHHRIPFHVDIMSTRLTEYHASGLVVLEIRLIVTS